MTLVQSTNGRRGSFFFVLLCSVIVTLGTASRHPTARGDHRLVNVDVDPFSDVQDVDWPDDHETSEANSEELESLRTWLRRNEIDDDGEFVENRDRDDIDKEKRRWGKNRIRVWGKRDAQRPPADSKRGAPSWSGNRIKAWGKRSADDTLRDGHPQPASWTEKAAASKRKWASNRVRVWGKRDYPERAKSAVPSTNQLADKFVGLTPQSTQNVSSQYLTLSPAGDDVIGDDVDDVVERRSAIVKRAIEDSIDDAWLHRGTAYYPQWVVDKRRSLRGVGSRQYYPSGGPKRSWRTNVIRVWGK